MNRLERTTPRPKLKFDNSSQLLKGLVDIVELNHLRTSVSAKTRTKTWSMISDNFVLSEENILVVCRLSLRMALGEDYKCDKELKELILGVFKVDYKNYYILSCIKRKTTQANIYL